MIVDYYSGFPVIILLSDNNSCNHFKSVLAKYGISSTIIAEFVVQGIQPVEVE